jgi:hypothetical protein
MPSVAAYAPEETARDAAPRAATKAAPAPQPSKPGQATGGAAKGTSATTASPAAETAATANPEPASRLRVTSGYLELVVNDAERARQRVIDSVGQMGGYVEATTADSIVVRVPASRFDEAMAGFSGLGEVRARSVESTDVTESYADLGRRIEIAKRTRQRLYDLLEKTKDVQDQVQILREIRRLTEEIEQMSSALSVMEGQIQLSRISVQLVSRIDETGSGRPGIPFPWIAALSPLRPSAGALAAGFAVAIPPEYAVFESGTRVRVEAADGTRFAMGAVPNEPRGDTAFWREALLYHLKDAFSKSDPVEAGRYQGAVFESKDIEPFSYLVAEAVRGDEILVAEAFFPNGASRARRLPGILTMLGEMTQ